MSLCGVARVRLTQAAAPVLVPSAAHAPVETNACCAVIPLVALHAERLPLSKPSLKRRTPGIVIVPGALVCEMFPAVSTAATVYECAEPESTAVSMYDRVEPSRRAICVPSR